jgi:hypothetical protein
MQRENILYMTDTKDVASFLADFCVLYNFVSLEYVECAGILITLLITYSSDTNLKIRQIWRNTYSARHIKDDFTLHDRNQTYALLFLDSVIGFSEVGL